MYKKAVTFSFDDGNVSDKRLVELFNKYNLKCSFNLNSGLYDKNDEWMYKDKFLVKKLTPLDTELYKGHEICTHGLLHKAPTSLSDEELYHEFSDDIENLSGAFEAEIVGAAYAYGNYDDRTVELLKKLGIKYSRTVEDSFDFKPQKDMLRFKPTCRFQYENIFELIDKFLADDGKVDDEKSDNDIAEPKIFYIWGHSYECDGDDCWELMEEICKRLSGRDDVLYGTNREVFEYFNMI